MGFFVLILELIIESNLVEDKPAASVWTLSSDDTVDEGITAVPKAKASSVWKISAEDEEDELEDENALLGAEDLLRPGCYSLSLLKYLFLFCCSS
jgi:hypothetical protein